MNSYAIKAIKQLTKKYFNIVLPDLNEEKDYFQLLHIFQKLEHKNKSELNLLLLLFGEIFVQQNKLKDVNYEDYSEFIGLLELKKIPNDTKNDKEYKVIYNCFKNSVLTEKENYLIYRLMCKNKSPLLLFKSVEEIISAKDECYTKNKAINLPNLNYYTLIYQVSLLFKNGENYLEKYTFDYCENKFIRRKLKNQELLEYLGEKNPKGRYSKFY